MRITTSNDAVREALARTAATIRSNSGFIADDFTVHERDGQIWCSIGERFGEPGRVLAHYPVQLAPIVSGLKWVLDPGRLVLAEPPTDQTPVQRQLLAAWIDLVNALDRMSHIRRVMPAYAIRSHPLRHHLADAGYPGMRSPSSDEAVRDTAIHWHGGPMGKDAEGTTIWRLLPIKSLVNHHPDGADQGTPVHGNISLATGVNSDDRQTYENYGDLDGMLCLMTFGYVDDTARVVHSVPVEVESQALGRVVVRWRAPREELGPRRRDVPILNSIDDGLEIRHLSFRPGNRATTARFLAMAVQSRSGLGEEAARRAAEGILDAVLDANLGYYSGLDRLVLEAGGGVDAGAAVLPMIADTSLRQTQRMRGFWG